MVETKNQIMEGDCLDEQWICQAYHGDPLL